MARHNRTTARNLAGQTCGRLTAIEPTARRSGNNVVWKCRCACGKEVFVPTKRIGKDTNSCGCLKADLIFKHGHDVAHKPTREYRAWYAMRARCNTPSNSKWHRYGGRGIRVCDRWNDFRNFLADMGMCPPGMTIDRENNDLGYSPDNCRWATVPQQNRNSSRTVLVTLNGRTQCLKDWCVELGINKNTVTKRRRNGWSNEKALTTPVDVRRHR